MGGRKITEHACPWPDACIFIPQIALSYRSTDVVKSVTPPCSRDCQRLWREMSQETSGFRGPETGGFHDSKPASFPVSPLETGQGPVPFCWSLQHQLPLPAQPGLCRTTQPLVSSPHWTSPACLPHSGQRAGAPGRARGCCARAGACRSRNHSRKHSAYIGFID